MTNKPLRFIMGATQILIGLALGWMALSAIVVLARGADEMGSDKGMLAIVGMITLTLVTCAACLANGWRLVNRPRFAPAYWRRLPTVTAVLLAITLAMWFVGVRA